MRKRISQRQARQSARGLRDLQRKYDATFSRWSREYPGGAHIDNINLTPIEVAIANTAIACGCVFLAKVHGTTLQVYGVRA